MRMFQEAFGRLVLYHCRSTLRSSYINKIKYKNTHIIVTYRLGYVQILSSSNIFFLRRYYRFPLISGYHCNVPVSTQICTKKAHTHTQLTQP
jgi:hypothetical protein